MMEDWKTRKFVEVTKLQGGNQPPKKTFIYKPKEGYVRLLQIRDFKSDDKAVYIPESDKNSMCTEDDILIGRYGASVGNICTGKAGAHNVALIKATPDPQILERRYYLYYLKSHLFQGSLMSVSSRSAQNGFNKGDLENFEIPIPPLPEQKHIVAILDKAFEAIDQAKANIERNIENAEELFQSKLNEIFSQRGEGWEVNKLGKACEISMGQSPKGITYNDEGIGTPLINGPVEFGPKPFSETVMSKWTTDPKKMCRKGDLILCVRGSTTGRINIAGFDACIGRGVASIRYEKNQKWLNYFIRANQEYIYSLGSGSTFPNVSGKILMKIDFPEPPIEVQSNLIDVMEGMVNNTNQILSVYRTKLQNIEELKKSILQKAFSGELTANEHVAA